MAKIKHSIYQILLLSGGVWLPKLYADTKQVYVIINDTYQGRYLLNEYAPDRFCFSKSLLKRWQIDLKQFSELPNLTNHCLPPSVLEKNTFFYHLDPYRQQLKITLPANKVKNRFKEDQLHLYEPGINGAFLSYQVNYNNYHNDEDPETGRDYSAYAKIRYGINYGSWRFRFQHYYSYDINEVGQWYTEYFHLERDIQALRARLRIGDSHTSSDIFESYSFRGVTFYSNEKLLPNSFRKTLPEIQGVAKTNAEVKVKQNGIVIYQTFVPPGFFSLKEVYPSDSGDLYLTIQENDGSSTTRLLPFSSVPNILQLKHLKYAFSSGRYHDYAVKNSKQPFFGQLSLSYGLPYNFTFFSGSLFSSPYFSQAVGIGKNLGSLGNLVFDYRYALAKLPNSNENKSSGGAYRLRYEKNFYNLAASVSATAEYYPEQNFKTFSKLMEQYQSHSDASDIENKRYYASIRVNKSLRYQDLLYLTLVQQNCYQKKHNQTSIQLGYGATHNRIRYDVSLSYDSYPYSTSDKKIGFTVSIPLSKINLPPLSLKYSIAYDKQERESNTLSLTGTTLRRKNLSFGIVLSKNALKETYIDTNMQYHHSAGKLKLGHSQQHRGRGETNIDLSGSLLLHAKGLTFGQELSETIALIEVPGTPNIDVNNQFGSNTNNRGYAIVSSLRSYQTNIIMINEASLKDKALHLPQHEIALIPTDGAIGYAKFAPAQKTEGSENDFEELEDAIFYSRLTP